MEKQVRITNKMGLHVRPAALFAQKASSFSSSIKVIKDGQVVNGKSSVDLLTLVAVEGSKITIVAEGSDEEEALLALVKLVEEKFGEE
jgi:phosphotransferase system HPr (HPr) family protein